MFTLEMRMFKSFTLLTIDQMIVTQFGILKFGSNLGAESEKVFCNTTLIRCYTEIPLVRASLIHTKLTFHQT